MPDGFATLTAYMKVLMHSCHFVCKVSSELYTDYKEIQFEVASVTLLPSLKLESESSDDQNFDGFFEVSEGEVTCKLYMVQEDLEQSVCVSDASSCTDGDSQASDDIPLSLLKKRIINNEKAISDSDDIFYGPCSSGSEYKVIAFERKYMYKVTSCQSPR